MLLIKHQPHHMQGRVVMDATTCAQSIWPHETYCRIHSTWMAFNCAHRDSIAFWITIVSVSQQRAPGNPNKTRSRDLIAPTTGRGKRGKSVAGGSAPRALNVIFWLASNGV